MTRAQEAPSSIPLIDFKVFVDGSEGDRQKIANNVCNACIHVGFLYIRNHGVPEELIERIFAQSNQFFNLPLEEKMQIR